jgi:hypothetical protein
MGFALSPVVIGEAGDGDGNALSGGELLCLDFGAMWSGGGEQEAGGGSWQLG